MAVTQMLAQKLGNTIKDTAISSVKSFGVGLKSAFLAQNPAIVGALQVSKNLGKYFSNEEKRSKKEDIDRKNQSGFDRERQNEQRNYDNNILFNVTQITENTTSMDRTLKEILEVLKRCCACECNDSMLGKLGGLIKGALGGIAGALSTLALAANRLPVSPVGVPPGSPGAATVIPPTTPSAPIEVPAAPVVGATKPAVIPASSAIPEFKIIIEIPERQAVPASEPVKAPVTAAEPVKPPVAAEPAKPPVAAEPAKPPVVERPPIKVPTVPVIGDEERGRARTVWEEFLKTTRELAYDLEKFSDNVRNNNIPLEDSFRQLNNSLLKNLESFSSIDDALKLGRESILKLPNALADLEFRISEVKINEWFRSLPERVPVLVGELDELGNKLRATGTSVTESFRSLVESGAPKLTSAVSDLEFRISEVKINEWFRSLPERVPVLVGELDGLGKTFNNIGVNVSESARPLLERLPLLVGELDELGNKLRATGTSVTESFRSLPERLPLLVGELDGLGNTFRNIGVNVSESARPLVERVPVLAGAVDELGNTYRTIATNTREFGTRLTSSLDSFKISIENNRTTIDGVTKLIADNTKKLASASPSIPVVPVNETAAGRGALVPVNEGGAIPRTEIVGERPSRFDIFREGITNLYDTATETAKSAVQSTANSYRNFSTWAQSVENSIMNVRVPFSGKLPFVSPEGLRAVPLVGNVLGAYETGRYTLEANEKGTIPSLLNLPQGQEPSAADVATVAAGRAAAIFNPLTMLVEGGGLALKGATLGTGYVLEKTTDLSNPYAMYELLNETFSIGDFTNAITPVTTGILQKLRVIDNTMLDVITGDFSIVDQNRKLQDEYGDIPDPESQLLKDALDPKKNTLQVSTPPETPITIVDPDTHLIQEKLDEVRDKLPDPDWVNEFTGMDFSSNEFMNGVADGVWDALNRTASPSVRDELATQRIQVYRQNEILIDSQKRQKQYEAERKQLQNQFYSQLEGMFRPMVDALQGPAGTFGPQSMVNAGTTLTNTLQKNFTQLGTAIFGKQYGAGIGQTFQQLAGVYLNEFINETLAPTLGIKADMLNRSINTYMEGIKVVDPQLKQINASLSQSRDALQKFEKEGKVTEADIIRAAGKGGFTSDQLSRIQQYNQLKAVVEQQEAQKKQLQAQKKQYNQSALGDLLYGMTGIALTPRNMIDQYGGADLLTKDLASVFGAPFDPLFGTNKQSYAMKAGDVVRMRDLEAKMSADAITSAYSKTITPAIENAVTTGIKRGFDSQRPTAVPGGGTAVYDQNGNLVAAPQYGGGVNDPFSGPAFEQSQAGGPVPGASGRLLGLGSNLAGMAVGKLFGGGPAGNFFGKITSGSVSSLVQGNSIIQGIGQQFGVKLGKNASFTDLIGGLNTNLTRLSGSVGQGLMKLGGSFGEFGAGMYANSQGVAAGAMQSGSLAQYGAYASQALGGLQGYAMGFPIAKQISGGYSAIGGSSGNVAINAGSAIGFALGGPVGAFLGSIGGGVLNRLWGKKTDLIAQGITGVLSGTANDLKSFTQTRTTYSGIRSWFNSNRDNPREYSALDPEVASAFSDTTKSIAEQNKQLLQNLGLSTTYKEYYGSKSGSGGIKSWFNIPSPKEMLDVFNTSGIGGVAASIGSSVANALSSSISSVDKDITEFTKNIDIVFTGKETEEEKLDIITKAFEEFSDDMITRVLPFMDQFVKDGEGASDALARLGNAFNIAEPAIRAIGFIDPKTFFALPTSIEGMSADYLKVYTSEMMEKLVAAFGGDQQFTTAFSKFEQLAFTEEERRQIALDNMKADLAEAKKEIADTGIQITDEMLTMSMDERRSKAKEIVAQARETAISTNDFSKFDDVMNAVNLFLETGNLQDAITGAEGTAVSQIDWEKVFPSYVEPGARVSNIATPVEELSTQVDALSTSVTDAANISMDSLWSASDLIESGLVSAAELIESGLITSTDDLSTKMVSGTSLINTGLVSSSELVSSGLTSSSELVSSGLASSANSVSTSLFTVKDFTANSIEALTTATGTVIAAYSDAMDLTTEQTTTLVNNAASSLANTVYEVIGGDGGLGDSVSAVGDAAQGISEDSISFGLAAMALGQSISNGLLGQISIVAHVIGLAINAIGTVQTDKNIDLLSQQMEAINEASNIAAAIPGATVNVDMQGNVSISAPGIGDNVSPAVAVANVGLNDAESGAVGAPSSSQGDGAAEGGNTAANAAAESASADSSGVSSSDSSSGVGNTDGAAEGGNTASNAAADAASSGDGDGASGWASGGKFPGNHPMLVGEAGPEIVVPNQGGTVIPTHKIFQALKNSAPYDSMARSAIESFVKSKNDDKDDIKYVIYDKRPSINDYYLKEQDQNRKMSSMNDAQTISTNAVVDNSVKTISSPSTTIINRGDHVRDSHPMTMLFSQKMTSGRY